MCCHCHDCEQSSSAMGECSKTRACGAPFIWMRRLRVQLGGIRYSFHISPNMVYTVFPPEASQDIEIINEAPLIKVYDHLGQRSGLESTETHNIPFCARTYREAKARPNKIARIGRFLCDALIYILYIILERSGDLCAKAVPNARVAERTSYEP